MEVGVLPRLEGITANVVVLDSLYNSRKAYLQQASARYHSAQHAPKQTCLLYERIRCFDLLVFSIEECVTIDWDYIPLFRTKNQ